MGRRVWVPVVSGPLAPFAAGYESWLRSRAYSPSAAADRVYQFDQLSRWLQRERLGAVEVTGEQAERFAAARRAAGLVSWAAPRSAMLPVGYLRGLGVAPQPVPVVAQGRCGSCSRIIAAICRSSVGCRITRCSMRMSRPRGCS